MRKGYNFFSHSQYHQRWVERAMFELVRNITSYPPRHDRVVFTGQWLSPDLRFPSLPEVMHHILRGFIWKVEKYYKLQPEEAYSRNASSHHAFLRLVAGTVLCAYFVVNPHHLRFPASGGLDIDLSPLPRWITKIVKKFTVHLDCTSTIVYYRYHQIGEE